MYKSTRLRRGSRMPSLSAAGSHDCLRVLAIDYERNPLGPVHLAWAVLTPGPGFFGPLRSPSFRRWHKSKFMALLREQSQHFNIFNKSLAWVPHTSQFLLHKDSYLTGVTFSCPKHLPLELTKGTGKYAPLCSGSYLPIPCFLAAFPRPLLCPGNLVPVILRDDEG